MKDTTPTHIYVIGYSDGVIKVGRTSEPRKRMTQLGYMGRKRGATITDRWIEESADPIGDEWSLRLLGRGNLRPAWGTEHFYGEYAPFLALVQCRLREWAEAKRHVETVGVFRRG